MQERDNGVTDCQITGTELCIFLQKKYVDYRGSTENITHTEILKRQGQKTSKGKLSFIIGYLERSLGFTSHS